MLRIHFVQQCFTLSDPVMEEALHDMPLFREFAGLGGWSARLPDETTIPRFRHLLEQHKLAAEILAIVNDVLCHKGLMLRVGAMVDAKLFAMSNLWMVRRKLAVLYRQVRSHMRSAA